MTELNASSLPAGGLSSLDDEGRKEYWATLALRHTAGIGARSACTLLKYFGSAYSAVLNVHAWPEAGIPQQKASGYLNNAWRVKARPEWDRLRTLPCSIILWTDSRYPSCLKELPDAPLLLYALGDLSLLSAPCVAIVGSRKSARDVLDFTSFTAKKLSEGGITVVSGLAFGVDGYAHRAALSGPGRTIAVMPGGVDMPFPTRHRELYNAVVKYGLAISEMPPGWIPGPGAFPVRNRIVSGLSFGVLVSAASHIKSGSIITARIAAEQGKNVYVPSPDIISSPCEEGTKKLLFEGARPIFQADDILADLIPHLKASLLSSHPPVPSSAGDVPVAAKLPSARKDSLSSHPENTAQLQRTGSQHATSAPKKKCTRPALTEEEETILSLLGHGPLSHDELLYAAQEKSQTWTSASVSAILMILEVKRLARRLPDTRYESAL